MIQVALLDHPLLIHGRLLESRRVGVAVVCGKGGGAAAGPFPEYQALGERVGAQAVGPVDRRRRTLAGGEQPVHRGLGIHIGGDAAHHVVRDRADGNELVDHVHLQVLEGELAHHGQFLVDLCLTEERDTRSRGPSSILLGAYCFMNRSPSLFSR